MSSSTKLFMPRKISWAFLDQGLVSGVNFLTNIMLIRLLGFSEYGRYTIAWMAILFIYSMQESFVTAPMMTLGPQSKDKAYYGNLFIQLLIFMLASSVVLAILVILGQCFFPSWQLLKLLPALMLVSLVYQLQDFIRRYYYVSGRPKCAFACDVVRYGLQLIGLLVCFATYQTITASEALWLISACGLLSVLLFLSVVKEFKYQVSILKQTISKNWYFSKWLTFSSLMQWASGNLVVLLSGALLGKMELGIIRSMQNIMGATHVILLGLDNVVPSECAKKLKQGVVSVEKYLFNVAFILAGIIALVAIPVYAKPDLLLGLLYGKAYTTLNVSYAWILKWYLFLYLVVFVNRILNYALRTIEYTKPIFYGYAVSVVFICCAAYFIIEVWGLLGVMLTLTAHLLINLMVLISGYRSKRCVFIKL